MCDACGLGVASHSSQRLVLAEKRAIAAIHCARWQADSMTAYEQAARLAGFSVWVMMMAQIQLIIEEMVWLIEMSLGCWWLSGMYSESYSGFAARTLPLTKR